MWTKGRAVYVLAVLSEAVLTLDCRPLHRLCAQLLVIERLISIQGDQMSRKRKEGMLLLVSTSQLMPDGEA